MLDAFDGDYEYLEKGRVPENGIRLPGRGGQNRGAGTLTKGVRVPGVGSITGKRGHSTCKGVTVHGNGGGPGTLKNGVSG